jgi:hypothetical protein
MGRPKTIYVDADEMLTAIHVHYESDLAEAIEAEESMDGSFGSHVNAARWERRQLEDGGLQIDFERFAQRGLTPSERIRHQECLRSLEHRGLVSIYGRKATRVMVTPAGLKRLRTAGRLSPESGPTAPAEPSDA